MNSAKFKTWVKRFGFWGFCSSWLRTAVALIPAVLAGLVFD